MICQPTSSRFRSALTSNPEQAILDYYTTRENKNETVLLFCSLYDKVFLNGNHAARPSPQAASIVALHGSGSKGGSTMTIKKIANENELTIALEGRLDTSTSPELEQVLKEELPKVSKLILDFEKLDYISSAGLRVLLFAQKAMNSTQGSMKIRKVGEIIMEIFEVTGFQDILDIE
jgi:anti-sigma B factor antagonist